MSEQTPSDEPHPALDLATGSASAGALLKAAREAQGLHIGILAVMLKVTVAKLEALEANRFEELNDVVFTRALASSMCRALKFDSAAVMAALPKNEVRRVKNSLAGLNTPIKTGRFALGEPLASRLIRPLGRTVGLLVLAIIAMLLWPKFQSPDVATSSDVLTPETQTSQEMTSAMPEPTASYVVEGTLSAVSQEPASTVQEAVSGAAVTPEAGSEILLLQSRGSSWVEVTDARGVLQLRKTLAPDEQIRLAGVLPLSVVLGRADEVEVSVRGQRLDVTGMTNDNVARFEVK